VQAAAVAEAEKLSAGERSEWAAAVEAATVAVVTVEGVVTVTAKAVVAAALVEEVVGVHAVSLPIGEQCNLLCG
jgi:hypothetical protein